jgi:hypothetical protein
LRELLAPLFAALDAHLSAVDGDVGQCLLPGARGHLPASVGWAKHDRLVAGGVRGGDAAWLLKCVYEKVIVLTLERAKCAALE